MCDVLKPQNLPPVWHRMQSPVSHLVPSTSCLLLFSSLLLLSQCEHEPSVLYGSRIEHEDAEAQKQKGYYEHIDWSDGTNRSKESLSEVRMLKQDHGRTQYWRTGTCFTCTTLSEKEQVDPNNVCYNITKYDEWKQRNSGEVDRFLLSLTVTVTIMYFECIYISTKIKIIKTYVKLLNIIFFK